MHFLSLKIKANHHLNPHTWHHRHHRGGEHGGRLFDYGELRLLVLAMIAEQPRHGHEIMKTIEERFGASSHSARA